MPDRFMETYGLGSLVAAVRGVVIHLQAEKKRGYTGTPNRERYLGQIAPVPARQFPCTQVPRSWETLTAGQIICLWAGHCTWIVMLIWVFLSKKPKGNLKAETTASVGICGFTIGIASCVWPESTALLAFIPCFPQARTQPGLHPCCS